MDRRIGFMRTEGVGTRRAGLVVAILVGSLMCLPGCRSNDGAAAKTDAEGGAKAEAEAPKGVAPPADHRMAKISNGMTPQQVQEVMGMPSGQARYPSGKAFAPFQYGNDSGWRSEYKYAGEGRVVFAEPRWGGQPKVIRVDYDPSEDGN